MWTRFAPIIENHEDQEEHKGFSSIVQTSFVIFVHFVVKYYSPCCLPSLPSKVSMVSIKFFWLKLLLIR